MAEASICRVDEGIRVVLPARFKGQVVSVEEVGAEEVRVRIVRSARRRPALAELLSQVTADNRHEAIDFGPPAGNEAL